MSYISGVKMKPGIGENNANVDTITEWDFVDSEAVGHSSRNFFSLTKIGERMRTTKSTLAKIGNLCTNQKASNK